MRKGTNIQKIVLNMDYEKGDKHTKNSIKYGYSYELRFLDITSHC